jgi:hypothetical protein
MERIEVGISERYVGIERKKWKLSREREREGQ